MSRRLLGFSLAAFCLALGCRTAPQASVADVAGSYMYAGHGTTLSKPWRFSAILDLRPDQTYNLTLDKTIEGNRDPTERSSGTFSIDGDHLIRHENQGKMHEDVHKLRIRPDSLLGELGWTAQAFLKGIGAPNLVFVRIHRT